MNMQKTKTILASATLVATALGVSQAAWSVEKTGTVKMYLMNPEGRVDGLLLNDGTQIHFPPHLSSRLTETVKLKDSVNVSGTKEASNTYRADKITNTASGKAIVDTPPNEADGSGVKPPPPPRPGRERLENLGQLAVSGTVVDELTGRNGEIDGVVLDNQAIVHFGPRVLDKSKVKLSKGSKIKVSGFGTKNDFGQSLEATEVTQQ